MNFLLILYLAIVSAELYIVPNIFNGKLANDGDIPFQVGLVTREESADYFLCGGSLISPVFIITAAHCIDKHPAENIITYMGSIYRENGTQRIARNKIIHEGWDTTIGNDIGLLQIDYVFYTYNIQSIALPEILESYPSYEAHSAIVSGWGFVSDYEEEVSSFLQYAELLIIPNYDCAMYYPEGTPPFVTDFIICAASIHGSTACRGDSGSPLLDRESRTLIGIASFIPFKFHCSVHHGNAFTRVTSYRLWIKDKTGI